MIAHAEDEQRLTLLELPPQCLCLVALHLPLRHRLQLAVVCRGLRDLLAASPQLWDTIDFDQYAMAQAALTSGLAGNTRQQFQRAAGSSEMGSAASGIDGDWQPWQGEPESPRCGPPPPQQLPAFLGWLAGRGAGVQRLRAVPCCEWSHVSVAPQLWTLCARISSLQHSLASLHLEARCLLRIGIWVAPLRRLRHLSASAASLSLSRHLAGLPALASLLLRCAPEASWDHDRHYGRLELEGLEEGDRCLPASLQLLSFSHLEAPGLPPGLAACTQLVELQLDNVLLDGDPDQRFAPLSALTALTALRLDCLPALVVPRQLGQLPTLQRLSLHHAPNWHPHNVQPADTTLEHSCTRLLPCAALTSLTFVGYDELPGTLWSLTQLSELVIGSPPAHCCELHQLTGLRRLSLTYDNSRAVKLLSEDAVQAMSGLTCLHLGGSPSQPGISFPLLLTLLRRLLLGGPQLHQLVVTCPGVQTCLQKVLSLESEGGAGFEFEARGAWMREQLQLAGGVAGLRTQEAAWVRRVWAEGLGLPPWLDTWRLPDWHEA